MQGQLGDRYIADLIRELYNKKASGLLRLSRGKTIKAIFFEAGAPVFAISNLANEQLEYKLVKDGVATPEQIEQSKAQAEKANRLGSVLVEMGLLSTEEMHNIVRRLCISITLSLFEWEEGEYIFDERMRAVHDVTLKTGVQDILLEGARRSAGIERIATNIAPIDRVIVRVKQGATPANSGKLIPLESYILSRIEKPTPISEVSMLSGLSEKESHRAVIALIAAGFLKLDGDEQEVKEEEEPDAEVQESVDDLRREVSRKLHFFESADFYEMLSITRHSSSKEIKAAYYQLAKKFHPDRYRQLDDKNLQSKLEAMFSKVTQAYETLSLPAQRAAYDERIKSSNGNSGDLPLAAPISAPPSERYTTSALRHSAPLPMPEITEQQQPQPAASVSEEIPAPEQGPPPAQNAEHLYQQGRARYDRKEFHAAVHLLREAIKADSSKPHYHYHLGVALIRNPRTRREAEQHLMKAAELDPYNAKIRLKLAVLYKEVGMPKRADHYFRETLSLDPDNRVAMRELNMDKKDEAAGSIWKADLGTIAKRLFKR